LLRICVSPLEVLLFLQHECILYLLARGQTHIFASACLNTEGVALAGEIHFTLVRHLKPQKTSGKRRRAHTTTTSTNNLAYKTKFATRRPPLFQQELSHLGHKLAVEERGRTQIRAYRFQTFCHRIFPQVSIFALLLLDFEDHF
jgi:hypothetical protein